MVVFGELGEGKELERDFDMSVARLCKIEVIMDCLEQTSQTLLRVQGSLCHCDSSARACDPLHVGA